jgi:hypothetical protein
MYNFTAKLASENVTARNLRFRVAETSVMSP